MTYRYLLLVVAGYWFKATRNEKVGGSIPLSGTSIKKARNSCGLFCV